MFHHYIQCKYTGGRGRGWANRAKIYRQAAWGVRRLLCLTHSHSSRGIHLLHHTFFLCLFSSSMLSFSVFTIFLWRRSTEASAFLCAEPFCGAIACRRHARKTDG